MAFPRKKKIVKQHTNKIFKYCQSKCVIRIVWTEYINFLKSLHVGSKSTRRVIEDACCKKKYAKELMSPLHIMLNNTVETKNSENSITVSRGLVMDDLARAGLESSNLIHGIEFTKSNEYTENRFKILPKKKIASSWRLYESLSTCNIHYWKTLTDINWCRYVSRPAILKQVRATHLKLFPTLLLLKQVHHESRMSLCNVHKVQVTSFINKYL